MTSQPGYQAIAIQIPKIWQSKSSKTMKLDKIIEYKKRFFFKNYAENGAGRLVSVLFLFFKNT